MMIRWQRTYLAAWALGMAFGGILAADRASAQTVPVNVVYGPVAHSREGDLDHRENLFISVPADLEGHLYLRLFDPEANGLHDTAYGSFGNSTVLFRLLGGEGAYTGIEFPEPVADGSPADPEADLPLPDEAGVLIAEQRFGAEPATDDRWVTLTPFQASQGEVRDGRAFFRLDVIGETGDDGNVFGFEVSLAPDASEPPADVRLFAFRPTLRWPGTREVVELRFSAPAGEQATLQNFDGAEASVELVSTFASMALPASGQDAWASGTFTVPEGDTAIEFKGGNETPNDITFALFDEAGGPLPFELPARLREPALRPEAVGIATPLADCRAVAFDASGSSGDRPLHLRWLFGDGRDSAEPVVVHRYDTPGRYEAELRVLGPSDRVASGSSLRLPVHVRNRPMAVAGEAVVAAPGDEILFDGSASLPSDRPISSFLWSFGDGSQASGAEARKTYGAPGLYRSVLRVADDADHPWNFGIAQRLVTINFQPTAEAGEARSAAVGEAIRLDGGASYDVDGEIAGWHWAFGDGGTASMAAADHAFQAPGVYEARLTVVDDAGVGNSSASDTVKITVNAPPVPVSTQPARPIAVGEIARFDATQSTDPDGEILDYQWAFGDGALAEGAVVEYAYGAPGIYEVRLTARDNSATLSDTAETGFSVIVSAAPVADAGPDQLVTSSEVVFDGGGSSDADGTITSYE